jgi:hypothetical protein
MMRSVLYLLVALVVMGLAFWAYRENYRTQGQIDRMQAVQNEMAVLRDNLGVLRAEWAFLNRPDRLRELVDLNFDRLRLVPVGAGQFGTAANVDYPAPDAPAPPDIELGAAGPAPAAAYAGGPRARPGWLGPAPTAAPSALPEE